MKADELRGAARCRLGRPGWNARGGRPAGIRRAPSRLRGVPELRGAAADLGRVAEAHPEGGVSESPPRRPDRSLPEEVPLTRRGRSAADPESPPNLCPPARAPCARNR